MSAQQEHFTPLPFIQFVLVAGVTIACVAHACLTIPRAEPTPPSKIVFQPADGCFYERFAQAQPPKRLERPCVSEQEVAAFKAGKPSVKLAGQLNLDAGTYAQQQYVYLAELAAFNESKQSRHAAFAHNVKPFFDFLDRWTPSAIIARYL